MQFVRKAEEALTGKKEEEPESVKSSNHGPHSSKLANKLDPRVDSDKDHRAAHTGFDDHTTSKTEDFGSGTGTTTGATNPHTSGTTHGTSGVTGTGAGVGTTHGTMGSTNAGPHGSNVANKADPRVDSDRDNRARHETTLTGAGTGAGLGSTHSTHGTTTHGTTGSANTGPHSSNIANKADPRVDSDRDNRARHGDIASSGLTSNATAGPHGSDLANKADPRVDSDRDNRARHEPFTAGTGTGLGSTPGSTSAGLHGSTLGSGTGATHGTTTTAPHSSTLGSGTSTGTPSYHTPGSSSDNAGPHSSNIANKLDPRVDSDRDNRARHEDIAGSGLTGSATAGPHGSDLANKTDPRVDSDRDHRSHQSLTGAGSTGTGTHGSALGSGLETGHRDAPAGSSYNTPATGTTAIGGSTGSAAHGSGIANKLDPRVDSDVIRDEGLQRKI